MLTYLVTILEWGPKYNLSKFQCDLLVGFTVTILVVPQGISYTYLHPVIGLYSSFIPPLIYAICGSSTNMAVGDTAAVWLFLASAIGVVHAFALHRRLLHWTLSRDARHLQADWWSSSHSHSMITGFMGGTAVIFIMQQLKGMLGLKHFTTNTDLVSIMCSINSHRDEFDT
ncbi:hypothetical protein ZIOFF_036996 [Zingiber officinale]|uniref:SLC26A/SulP transporter domain-containing protein n=1 Tax=Zingiber officinale TaxID=94328 RepID=A0A8J5GAW0_ZINOF|nr:hypothetical protein ZIOFF_036996 [Zingiber officinale]